jgi:ankyrin repeat protein
MLGLPLCVKLLLDNGADVNMKTSYGMTPLDSVIDLLERKNIGDRFLEGGANIWEAATTLGGE